MQTFLLARKITALHVQLLLLCLIIQPWQIIQADIVKPALIEISVYKRGQVNIELRTSIEALMTGINGQYKRTQDAPQAEEYDVLRKLSAQQLGQSFTSFQSKLLEQIWIQFDGKKVKLNIGKIDIPPTGYTKVPRISTINITGKIPTFASNIQVYYPIAFGDSALRIRQVDQVDEQWHWSEWQWIRSDEASQVFSLAEIYAKRPKWQIISHYITLGYQHILPKGLDHILFILGLFLLSIKFKPLISQITLFTLAHTLTLGLAIAGYIELPARIVEPLIALSIAYVGIENIFTEKLHKSRSLLVFCFGLLHGLGFASVLADFGMPDNAFISALISFNVGVELGQLSIILMAFLSVGWWFGNKPYYHQRIVIPSSAIIAILGLIWFFERLSG